VETAKGLLTPWVLHPGVVYRGYWGYRRVRSLVLGASGHGDSDAKFRAADQRIPGVGKLIEQNANLPWSSQAHKLEPCWGPPIPLDLHNPHKKNVLIPDDRTTETTQPNWLFVETGPADAPTHGAVYILNGSLLRKNFPGPPIELVRLYSSSEAVKLGSRRSLVTIKSWLSF